MFPSELEAHARRLLDAARDKRLLIATAESCTGGLISGLLTEIPGSSDVVDRGFVTYSNAAKTHMLGVPPGLIGAFGAVSSSVARAMAEGALRNSNAHIAVAVTGIAGPGGGTPDKPVGTVWIAVAKIGQAATATLLQAGGDRAAIRAASVVRALALLVERCEEASAGD